MQHNEKYSQNMRAKIRGLMEERGKKIFDGTGTVNGRTCYRIEQYETDPQLSTLIKIADDLDIDLMELFS